MKKFKYLFFSIFLLGTTIISCDDKAFGEYAPDENFGQPKNLIYNEVLNAVENSRVVSGIPTVDSDGVIPTYEIVSARDSEGSILDDTYMSSVSITGTEEKNKIADNDNNPFAVQPNVPYTAVNSNLNGVVEIAEGNKFGIGDYYFTIKATTNVNGKIFEEVFEDVLLISFGAAPATLLYSPVAQNLVIGVNTSSSQPYITGGNPDISFGLGSDTDKLDIDPETGIISLKSGYTTTVNDTIYPAVQAISNITGEVFEYQGEGFLWLVASNDPVDLPRVANYFFQPTFEEVGTKGGYFVDVINEGDPNNLWSQTGSAGFLFTLLDPEAPELPEKRGLVTNLVKGGVSTPHESDVILTSQNLSIFQFGFDVKAVFYYYNRYVEYFTPNDVSYFSSIGETVVEGESPTDFEVYISFDYSGNNGAATWTKVNDLITSQVEQRESFTGLSYPGPWKAPFFTDFKREEDAAIQKSDGKWCRAELDLKPYLNESNFTLKFKVKSNFSEARPFREGGSAANLRSGRYIISDLYYLAQEE